MERKDENIYNYGNSWAVTNKANYKATVTCSSTARLLNLFFT